MNGGEGKQELYEIYVQQKNILQTREPRKSMAEMKKSAETPKTQPIVDKHANHAGNVRSEGSALSTLPSNSSGIQIGAC